MYTITLVPSTKEALCPPLRYLWPNDYKGKGISGRDHYLGPIGSEPLYILSKCDVGHRMHCLVFTSDPVCVLGSRFSQTLICII